MWRIETAVFAFRNRAPSSASAADDMTARMIWDISRTAPLFVGMSLLADMNMCPPARLRALGLDRYDASLWIARTMLLALYVSIASSWDAIESKNNLHSFIVFSVGFACCDARALSAGRMPPSMPRARKRKVPQTSWMNNFPALSRGGDVSSAAVCCVLEP